MFPGSLFSAPSLNDFQNSDPALRRCNRPGKRGGAGIRSRNPGSFDSMNLDHVASERVFVRLVGHRYDLPHLGWPLPAGIGRHRPSPQSSISRRRS
jgi:hypothetical protein